jgi:hypothetical protein
LQKELKDDPAVTALCEKFSNENQPKRSDLIAIGAEVAQEPQDVGLARKLVVATLMWGYGTKGRVYVQAPRALSEDAERLEEAALGANDALRNYDVKAAYDSFRLPRHPKGYNWGFFTKYLYFFGQGLGWPDGLAPPLIWDSRVTATLNYYEELFGWHPVWPRGVSNRYSYFCESVFAWADELGVRPDQVELVLFRSSDIGGRAELLELAAHAIHESGGPSAHVQELIQALPPELRDEVLRRVQRLSSNTTWTCGGPSFVASLI